MKTESTAGIRKSNRRWQSEVIVDLVKRYGFPYVALAAKYQIPLLIVIYDNRAY